MIEQTIPRSSARQLYNRMGAGLARMEPFEWRAKAQALALLGAAPDQQLLHIGVGTGGEHATLQAAVAPGGLLVGYDLARTMLTLTRQRAITPLCEGDAAQLPFRAQQFHRLFSAYTLDLLPLAEIKRALREFHRVLRPDGRLVLVSLTDGTDTASRLVVAAWRLVYKLQPQLLGGCRPLQVAQLMEQAGFSVQRQVIVQHGFPSEVLTAIPLGLSG